jgi:hypothetical protein
MFLNKITVNNEAPLGRWGAVKIQISRILTGYRLD